MCVEYNCWKLSPAFRKIIRLEKTLYECFSWFFPGSGSPRDHHRYHDNGQELLLHVAKTKVDNLAGKFYLIQLGTDCLETLFGLVHTAVGMDTNVDVLQLGSRMSGLTEVDVILSINPKWDHSP